MFLGTRVFGLRSDAINFVKEERRGVCNYFFLTMKGEAGHDQSIFGPEHRGTECWCYHSSCRIGQSPLHKTGLEKKIKDTQLQQQQSSCRVTFSNAIPSQDQAQ
jgi:hypothetical protein